MSFIVDGRRYEIWALDTNIVSEMVKKPMEELRTVLLWSIENYAILGISIWTILELRQRQDIYNLFIEKFSHIPFNILKSPTNLFADEIKSYPDTFSINPTIYPFNPFSEKKSENDLNVLMTNIFNNPIVKKAEEDWNSGWKEDGLKNMLSLKKDFPPSGDNYTSSDLKRFIEIGVPQYVFFFAPEFAKKNKSVNPIAFPSVKMCFYTVFYRHYDAVNRKHENQDAFDIYISSVTPYVDRVFTENFQAEIVRKVKNRDKMLSNIEVETIQSIKEKQKDIETKYPIEQN